MAYFIKYTETPETDFLKGITQRLPYFEICPSEYNDYFKDNSTELPGLYAFKLNANCFEEAVKEAAHFYFNVTFNSEDEFDSYCVLEGKVIAQCLEGVLIKPARILHIEKRRFFAEI